MIVIPEIDMPGHMVSAIACYSYLSCFDRRIKVATHWGGVKHDILCAGKESTYKFIYDVIDELTDLFPDKYFHIGGDEALKQDGSYANIVSTRSENWGFPMKKNCSNIL